MVWKDKTVVLTWRKITGAINPTISASETIHGDYSIMVGGHHSWSCCRERKEEMCQNRKVPKTCRIIFLNISLRYIYSTCQNASNASDVIWAI